MRVIIVGATGSVGKELITLIEKNRIDFSSIQFYASERSKNKVIFFHGREYRLESIEDLSFEKADFAFFCTSSAISKKLSLKVKNTSCRVIDLSSAFRMEEKIPLIIPEINGHLLKQAFQIISSPNCVASILSMVLYPLLQISSIKRVVVSTYQAASGGGQKLLDDLLHSTKEYCEGKKTSESAFNLYLHPSDLNNEQYSGEEEKIILETQKILDVKIPISVTSVRVPTLRAHSLSVNVEFAKDLSVHTACNALQEFPGIQVVSNTTPRQAQEKKDVFVSRIRKDLSHKNTLDLWVCSDQLLKGASLNALQIYERALSLSSRE